MTKIISKTRLKNQARRKTNPFLIEIIRLAQKQKPWLPLAKILVSSTRKYSSLNLNEIDSQTKTGDTVVIPGKVLSLGELTKKIRIASLGFSALAKEKMKKTKSEAVTISEEIKYNPKAEGIKILR
jgi:large subunit ribosomal protein L18e